MKADTDPEVQDRIQAAADFEAAAKILVEECGYDPDEAIMAAGIMRGESDGDVIDPADQ